MPVKRSRIGRSTTSVDTLVMPPPAERRVAAKIPAAGSSAKGMKLSEAAEEGPGEERPGILSVSSPVRRSEAEPSAGFLERCYYCKKEMAVDADVFMYSYLRAFCSVECRERQITMDNMAAKGVIGAPKRSTN